MMTIYKYNVIRELEHLADADYQKIAWFENNQNLCSSYSEDVEGVFMDTGLEDALDAGATVFGIEADAALRDLGNACDAIGYKRDEKELIDSPEMEILRQKAAHALTLIKEKPFYGDQVGFLAWIHIPILGKKEKFTRSAHAEELSEGYFRILETSNAWHDYPKDEIWKFNPSDIVRCEKSERLDSWGNKYILAVEKVG